MCPRLIDREDKKAVFLGGIRNYKPNNILLYTPMIFELLCTSMKLNHRATEKSYVIAFHMAENKLKGHAATRSAINSSS